MLITAHRTGAEALVSDEEVRVEFSKPENPVVYGKQEVLVDPPFKPVTVMHDEPVGGVEAAMD